MENEKKIKVALVRGDSLNVWEGGLWNDLPGINIVGFCARKNLYDVSGLEYPIQHLGASTDNIFTNNLNKFVSGIFQKMTGLEKRLVDFDIAHTVELSYYYTLQAVRAKKYNSRLKVVTTVWDNSFGRFEYNYWPGFSAPPSFWRKKMHEHINEAINGVDLLLPVSQMGVEMLLDLGVKEEKIQVLTPAIAVDKVDAISSVPFGLNGKELYFMVNRLVKEKGVYDVLYAWKMFRKEKFFPNKVLVIIGNGPEEKNMRRLVSEWGMGQSVVFIGSVPNSDLRTFYRQAKVLILASMPNPLWQEQFGYVLAEAISQGCPVVSTYSGAIPEVIENAGLLFSPGNPIELKNCLIKLDSLPVYNELRGNCERVKSKFAAGNFTKKLIGIYRNLLTDRT